MAWGKEMCMGLLFTVAPRKGNRDAEIQTNDAAVYKSEHILPYASDAAIIRRSQQ
jgi:hypothetical protein